MFLIATQEMDFNFFSGCSVWGLFNENPVAVQLSQQQCGVDRLVPN